VGTQAVFFIFVSETGSSKLSNDASFTGCKAFFLGMKQCDSSYDKSGEDRNGQT
jgi:hypothetical protein